MLTSRYSFKIWDVRRKIVIPGDLQATLQFCVEHFIDCAKKSIADHGYFYVALSGGSTPKAIFEALARPPYSDQVAWDKVHLFWSDERSVPPDRPESNYRMAMDAGLSTLAIPSEQIHRMHAEEHIEKNAAQYEQTIQRVLQGRPFDLIMLGMGEDGHTASLFPHTQALHVGGRLVTANFVPQKHTWRMSLTYDCINQAHATAIYVIGGSKKEMLAKVLTSQEQFEELPIQKIGTPSRPALWIADKDAAAHLPI